MTRTAMLAAALVLAAGTAGAQTSAPGASDTRRIDQSTAVPPASSAAPSPTKMDEYGNWRTSNGFNNDRNNPNAAPGPSSTSTSPTR